MLSAFFLDSHAGPIFCLAALQTAAAERRRFLILAPFAEEMNKSRHVLSALLRSIGAAGHDAVLPDLYGSGDSAGDFGDADIDVWRADIARVIEHTAGDRPISIIGLRSGALLAVDTARRHHVDALTLLHPVVDGRQQLNQFLRLRLAAGLTGDGPKETAADLRRCLADGEALEIAGYRLSPAMAQGLESLRMEEAPNDPVRSVHWIEVVADDGRGLMPKSVAIVDAWRQAGCEVRTDTVVGDTFWATQEIAQCPDLVDTAMRGIGH